MYAYPLIWENKVDIPGVDFVGTSTVIHLADNHCYFNGDVMIFVVELG